MRFRLLLIVALFWGTAMKMGSGGIRFWGNAFQTINYGKVFKGRI